MTMKWTDRECLRLVELFNDGLTDKQIGIELGRTAKAIANQRNKIGLCRISTTPKKPTSRPNRVKPINYYIDCMDWPFPFVKPKTREISH